MFKQTLLAASAALLITACATSPLGRKQLILMPESQMAQMGHTAYAQMKQQRPLSQSSEQVDYVRCVANHITRAMGSKQQWEVNVFADDSANAFALPGGKIGVHTGLLKVATNQHQLAAVMGHEVGHVIAQHSNERMSIEFATSTGAQLAQSMAGERSQEKDVLFGLLGLGAQVGITLPFSRKHETEADIIGLELIAKAGFDPRESVTLWQNMAKASNGQPPEFLSTHPSHSTRIKDLKAQIPAALRHYQAAQAQGKKPECGG